MIREAVNWIAYFYIYCFMGWCIESAIVSVSQRKPVNRGFLKGPVLPIYGFGAVTMVASCFWVPNEFSPLHVLGVYFSGLVAATLLELVAGILIENIFKVKYWDYTGKFGNFKGYICLKSSLFWGVLTVVLVFFIHKPVEAFVDSIPSNALFGVTGAVTAVVLVDFITSFKEAFDVQKFLAYQAKVQLELDEIKAKIVSARENLVKNSAYGRETPGEKAKLFERIIAEQEQRKDVIMEELGRYKQRAKNGFARLRNYPTAHSKKFESIFAQWKEKRKDM